MNAPSDMLIGMLLERRYRIDALIARGGMSSVYLGMDLRLDRPVAVKVMDPRFSADPQFLARLEFEARSVARLKDPGLVAVYDQGADGDYAFLVMELVQGGTLRELLRERGPMPPHAVTAVTAPVLGALGSAHRAGLVHRDVKPENVLISDDGEVKVVDFGLVRAIAAAGITSNSVILGTAAYLSPEQVESASADARSDVYSTGILVFEMLTGRTPFTGDTALGLAYQRLNNDVPAPSSLIPGVPPEFDEFVLTSTARNPENRYRDGYHMREVLTEIATDLDLPAFTVPAPTRSAERETMVAFRDRQQRPPAGPPGDPDGTDPISAQPVSPQPGGRNPTRIQTLPPDTRHQQPPPGPPRPQGPPGPPPPSAAMMSQASAYAEQRRKSRRTALIWVLVVMLVATLLGVGGWWLGSGRFTTVPELTGMDRVAATEAIEDAGLDVVDDPTYDNDLPVDQVMSAQPVPGTRVSRFSDVTLAYSVGQPKVPDLSAGDPLPEVEQRLRERTLAPKVTRQQYSNTAPKGSVVSLTPNSGTTVPVGSEIQITTSRGPEPISVPDVSGREEDDAAALLQTAKLKTGNVRREFSPDIDGGKVIGTSPGAGEMAEPGSTVDLIVSDAISVPDLSGKTPDEARRTLQDAGLIAQDGGTSTDGTAKAGEITSASPAFGARVDPRNPVVRIFVSDAVSVPNVTGDTVGTAKRKLGDAGLKVNSRGLTGSNISIVVSQSPSGGTRIKQGTTVDITSIP
ncbi:serine/threonine-protein kinase [Williamsia limnetica]|uniref:non-specific serine/threonine protein kinase n=1 Tax=Williamsia limnetica TaxID=882452 RepID=A0A318RMC9_WILLI|nr:Stk1 family PASTA domain-containing Ser/Thr kinase [Williamsia limnetica]PYE15776.1 serine/threonine-protein kinase [Williamsia limnetica]